jgi:uncharacterized protein YegJ (DUF2314 family)
MTTRDSAELGAAMRNPKLVVLGLTLVILAVSGCRREDRPRARIVERRGAPDVVYVDDNDPTMSSAIQRARSTVGQFIQALGKPKPSQSSFSVKVTIRDGDSKEYMWLIPVDYDAGRFSGTIDNQPDKVKTIKLGDKITVKKEEICDWMYVDDGKLVGGYTIRALRDLVPANKRLEYDRSVPFTID